MSQVGNGAKRDHGTPYLTVILVNQQREKLFRIRSDQFGFEIANFVQDFKTIAGDVLVFVGEVIGNFTDACLVFRFSKFLCQELVRDFVATMLKE